MYDNCLSHYKSLQNQILAAVCAYFNLLRAIPVLDKTATTAAEMLCFITFCLYFNPSCTKVFGTHTFYEGVEPTPPPPMISKTVDPTNFNFGRPLGLSMRGKKTDGVDDLSLDRFPLATVLFDCVFDQILLKTAKNYRF